MGTLICYRWECKLTQPVWKKIGINSKYEDAYILDVPGCQAVCGSIVYNNRKLEITKIIVDDRKEKFIPV